MSENKIGWQKYEDMLEQQMQSPLFQQLYRSFQESMYSETVRELEDFSEEEIEEIMSSQQDLQPLNDNAFIPVDDKLIENINLVTNFDCWMGHTNFDITPRIKDELNCIAGVEIMKICTRYRFFIGIGRMFDFSEVRKEIEDKLDTTNEE